jgi:hypothetical protein
LKEWQARPLSISHFLQSAAALTHVFISFVTVTILVIRLKDKIVVGVFIVISSGTTALS